MIISYLILGGNIGDRMNFLRQGVDLLDCRAGRVINISSIYQSEPWGYDDPQWFLNQAVALETNLSPLELLETIQTIEKTLGRQRTHNGFQARTIDIDIILYGNNVINTSQLVVPHPRMTERMFVLQPFAEIAPDVEHPVLHLTIERLRNICKDSKQVKLIDLSFRN